MKKILLLSLLVLFGCSKDSEGENAAPGDEIIGTHQIIDNPDEGWKSMWMSVEQGIRAGTITFNNNYKGFYDIDRGGDANTKRNFDWSFDGQRWNIIEEELAQWTVSFFSFYTMRIDVANKYGVPRDAIFYFE
tara:strand:- start:133 stop:531 length:399 start_codon:yes stop_codon:yes gene_type:complete